MATPYPGNVTPLVPVVTATDMPEGLGSRETEAFVGRRQAARSGPACTA